MHHDGIEFHNVAELPAVDGGRLLQRVPEAVRERLNDGARNRMRIPANAELRFASEGATVEVTLSCPDGEATLVPFWGPFQGNEVRTVGAEPETLSFSYPDRLATVGPDAFAEHPFSPRVWRLVFQRTADGPVLYHGIEGEGLRPPDPGELPDRRYLAYGTSITEGAHATRAHLPYAAQAARRLGADLVNLGSSGSAYCERAIADHVAGRDDWDVATLALSVNMLGAGFTVEEFRERAAYMVDAVARTGKPVLAITLFPLWADLDPALAEEGWEATPEEYRAALREVVAEAGHDNLHLAEGPEIMTDVGGHVPDVLHPGDHGMIEMGENVAAELESLL